MYRCPECGKQLPLKETVITYDIYGIPFRRLCPDCAAAAMENGFDGRDYRGDHSEEIEEIY